MKAQELYDKLENDFIKPEFSDDWADNMDEIKDYLSDNFKQRSMGLVCDFAEEVNNVFSAVFPSVKVIKEILDKGTENAMLFVHHPSIWDIRKAPKVFSQISFELLEQFKERKISVYNLHIPLDHYGEYSTSNTLAETLKIKHIRPFGYYFGSLCGIFGKTELKTVYELKLRLEKAIGHEAKLYNYGSEDISGGNVAIIGGGGNDVEFLEEIKNNNVNTFVTGITAKNDHSKQAHEYAEKNKINIIGGTHYSTEKFACIKICEYFKKLGLDVKFLEDDPIIEDM